MKMNFHQKTLKIIFYLKKIRIPEKTEKNIFNQINQKPTINLYMINQYL